MIFILDRALNVLNIIKNHGGVDGAPPFFDDVHTQDLNTGAETFQFTTIDSNGVGSNLEIGNYVAFKGKNGKAKLFQIMSTESSHEEVIFVTVYCESAGLELINKVFRKRKINSCTLKKFIDTVTVETGWQRGSLFLTDRTLDLDLETSSVYATLQNNVRKFGGELEFRVEIENGRVTGKYIDVPFQRGRITGKRFEYSKNIESIHRKIDATELFDSLVGIGKDGITFENVTVKGIDKPLGQDFVVDQEAFKRYNNNGRNIMGLFEFDTTSPEELLLQTYKELQKKKYPKVEYEIGVALLKELTGDSESDVSIGDTVSVIDHSFNPPIALMARVTKLEESKTDQDKDTCTLANFIEVQSNITEEMRRMASKLEGYVDNTIGSKFPIGGEDIKNGAISTNHIVKDSITTELLNAEVVNAVKGKFEELEAKDADIAHLIATKAEITSVDAVKIDVEKLRAKDSELETAIIKKAEILEGNIETLKNDKAEIKDLHAVKGSIDKLNGKVAEIDVVKGNVAEIETIVNGNISSTNIQSGGITGDRLNMKTVFIEDGNILNISAAKINSGEINTGKVLLKSEDGGMKLIGSTQQFLDEKGNVRIQLGKDAHGSFDFYIMDDKGNILFNTNGITGNAIEKGLIKGDMIGKGEVGGDLINWASFTSEFNKESNTSRLKASKVVVDKTGQALDVAFNEMGSKVDGIKSETDSHTTQLNVHQGRIDAIIADTTIEKNGKKTKLKDSYNSTVVEVDSMKNTIAKQQTVIDDNTGKITATQNKANELKRDLDSTVSRVTASETNINKVKDQINGINTEINSSKSRINEVKQDLNGVTIKVGETEKIVTSHSSQIADINSKADNAITKSDQAKKDAIVYSDELGKKLKADAEKYATEVATAKTKLAKEEVMANLDGKISEEEKKRIKQAQDNLNIAIAKAEKAKTDAIAHAESLNEQLKENSEKFANEVAIAKSNLAKEEAIADAKNKISAEEQKRVAEAKKNLEVAIAKANEAESKAKAHAEALDKQLKADAQKYAEEVAVAKANLAKEETVALLDGKITAEEQKRIKQAQDNLNIAIAKANEAESKAKTHAENLDKQLKADAQKYANEVAIAKSNLAKEQAIANADGKISAEEQKRIKQAQDNLNTAIAKANEAENKAKAHANEIAELKKNEAINVAKANTTNALNYLEVGGRNLALNSSLVKFSPNNVGLGDSELHNDSTGSFYRAIPSKGKTVSLYYFCNDNRVSEQLITDGKTLYSMSLDVRTPKDSIVTRFNIENGTWERVTLPKDKWTRIKIEGFTLPSTTNKALIVALDTSVDVYLDYKNLKLEKGNKATEWTPAPEDLKIYAEQVAIAKANLAKTEAMADNTKKIAEEEQKRIKQAQDNLNTALSKADKARQDAIDYSKALSEKLKVDAQKYADEVAVAKSNLAKTEAVAYADGKISAEEQKRITEAKANLNTAITKAEKAKSDAITHAENLGKQLKENAERYADGVAVAKANLAKEQAIADAKSKISEEEKKRLAEAKKNLETAIAKANEAESKAKTHADTVSEQKKNDAINASKNFTKESISNIEVGGTNLLDDSERERTNHPNDRGEYLCVDITSIIKENLGKEITLSGEIKAKEKAGYISIYSLGKYQFNASTGLACVTDKYTPFSLTIKPTYNPKGDNGECSNWSFYGQYDSKVFPCVRKLKVELGNKATSWTPSRNDLNKYVNEIAITKANLAKTEAIANADGKITAEEQKRIKQAQDNLNTAIAKANEAESKAKAHANEIAELKKNEAISHSNSLGNQIKADAQKYANEVAIAKAELAKQQAIVDATNKITAEEQKRLKQAQDNLNTAIAKAEKAKTDAIAHAENLGKQLKADSQKYINDVASAKSELVKQQMVANIDGKITAEEQKRIAEAKKNLDIAIAKANEAENKAKAHANTIAELKKNEAINTATNNINNSINNLQISIRNLALNSNFDFGWEAWGFNNPNNNATVQIVKDNILGNCVKVTTQTSGQGVYAILKRKPKTTYSWSFMIKSDKPCKINVTHENGEGTKEVSLTTEWTKITGTGIWNGNGGALCFYSNEKNQKVTYYLTNLIYVEGNKVGDWSPAPEDIKKYADNVAIAKANLAKTEAIANADGKITAEEQKRIKQAQDNLNTAIARSEKAKADAITHAENLDKQLKLDAQKYAEQVAIAKANLAKTEAIANADGKITAEEQKRIAEAKKNLETAIAKANEAESKAKTHANTVAEQKKNEAISSASQIAEQKKNDAINTAKGYTNNQISEVNVKVKDADANIKVLKDQIKSKVSQVDIDKSIKNIKFGGRNLALQTQPKEYTSFSGRENDCQFNTEVVLDSLSVGDPITISFKLYYENLEAQPNYNGLLLRTQGSGDVTQWSSGSFPVYDFTRQINFGKGKSGEVRIEYNYIITNDSKKNKKWYFNIRMDGVAKGKLNFSEFMVEYGTHRTAYTPAPEDVQKAIVDSKNEVTEKINKATSEINQTKDSINASVKGLQSETQKITTNVANLDKNLTNKIASNLNDAKNFANQIADQKKNDAINHANSIAEQKKNEAIRDSRYVPDTRGDNQNPSWYFSNYPRQTITEFKLAQSIKIPVKDNPYGTLETKVPWGDSSGGYPVQTFRSNSTSTYQRHGVDASNWSSWEEIENTTGSQAKVNAGVNAAKQYTNAQITTVNQKVSNVESSVNVLKDKISLKVEKTDIDRAKTELVSRINNIDSLVNNTKELASAMSLGKMLFSDPTFKNNSNSINTYNNKGNGTVTVSRISKIEGCPSDSKYCIEIKTTGEANPNHGGFYFGNLTRANAIFVTRIIAKIPVGLSIGWYSNATGNNSSTKWLTPVNGTGKWQEYIHILKCGDSGTFSSTSFFALDGSAKPSNDKPIIWHLAYATVFDLTENDESVNILKTEVSTAKNQIAKIETNVNGITQRVSNTESKTHTIENNLNGKASKSEVTEVNNKVTTIKSSIDSITQRVSNTESKTNQLNGKLASAETRITNAEQKITPNAIINTVSSTIDNKINNINLGGTNIPYNSGYCMNLDYWTSNVGGGATAQPIKLDSGLGGQLKGVTLTNTALPKGWCILENISLTEQKFKFNVGEYYTISGKIWTSNATDIGIQISDGNSSNSVLWKGIKTQASRYVDFKFTFKAEITGNENHIRFMINSAGTSLFVPYFKLEKGTVATDWSANPREVGERLSVVNKNFTEFKQSTDNFKWTVEQRSTMRNLIPNGSFEGDGRAWLCNGEFWSGKYSGYGFKGRCTGAIRNRHPYNNPEQYLMTYKAYKVKKYTTYTVNFKYALEKNCHSMDVFAILSNSEKCEYGNAIQLYTATGGSQTDNDHEKCISKTFNTGQYEWVWLRFDNNGMKSGVNIEEYCWLYVSEVGLYEGNVGSVKWCPANGEAYSTSFQMDEMGFKASFPNGSYTLLDKDGFEWYDAGSGHSYHALTYVTSFGIPAGNPGRTWVKLPREFTKRKNSLKWTVALRGYYYSTSGNFFPFHVHVTGGNEYEENGLIVCPIEGYCRIQNAGNSNDVQPQSVTAMLIAIA